MDDGTVEVADVVELAEYRHDLDVLRRTSSLFPSGVAAVAAVVDGRRTVLVASSFQVGISADPPLVLFAVQHTSTSWPRLRQAGRLGVSVLAQDHDGAARQLASKAADRFAGIDTVRTASGAVLLRGAPVWMECSIHTEVVAGDHDVVLLEVHALQADAGAAPLVWHGSTFRSLTPLPPLEPSASTAG